MSIRKNNGVTLIALIVAIAVVSILAGISLYGGTKVLKQAKLESLRTNMLLIQAKAKEYVEEAVFKMGISPDEGKKAEVRNEVYVTEAGLDERNGSYYLNSNTFQNWGLSDIELKEGEEYYITFDEDNETVEVYNTLGFNGKTSLTEISEIEI